MANTEATTETDVAVFRNTPQQPRSRVTLEKLENAIRAVLRDPANGRDRFTTAQVAELAGVSIGTAYRYFVDRNAMLDHIWPNRGDTFLPGK